MPSVFPATYSFPMQQLILFIMGGYYSTGVIIFRGWFLDTRTHWTLFFSLNPRSNLISFPATYSSLSQQLILFIMGVIISSDTSSLCTFFYSMVQKRNIEASNTAPSPKRTTRATSRADKGTSRGSVVNDETTKVDGGRKHVEQVSFRAEKLCCMNPFFMPNL